MATIEQISKTMQDLGASRILIKPLSNNDNSKQQIYLGGDFEVIQDFPLGEIRADGESSKGPIFKAPLKLIWITPEGKFEEAEGSQIILYPKYPEIRLSGFLRGCSTAPRHLMKPPTSEERELYLLKKRGMILGLSEDVVFAYVGSWDEDISKEILKYTEQNPDKQVLSVFYEYYSSLADSQNLLIRNLKGIYSKGPIRSRRLDRDGKIIFYEASNGAGFTLECEFGIVPNANASPDFLDWELKARSKSNTTLMTPEPDLGFYRNDYPQFMSSHANRRNPEKLYFTAKHQLGIRNPETKLTLYIEGYDLQKKKITKSDGGYFLKNDNGEIAAGWTFSKLLNHWKNKHTKTCYVSYKDIQIEGSTYYHFGPKICLAQGASIENFLDALSKGIVVHDPGCRYALDSNTGKWKQKKRNQFRVSATNSAYLYDEYKELDLSLE